MDIWKRLQQMVDPVRVHDEASAMESKAFCMLPWVHLYVSPHGYANPCCLAPWEQDQVLGDLNKQSVAEVWNGEPMRELRRKMLRDQPDKRCWQCYENERLGIRSQRQNSNHDFRHRLEWAIETGRDGSVRQSKPIYWDIRISNLCNFKCRICGHHSSSKWYEEAKELQSLSFPDGIHKSVRDFDGLLDQLAPFITDLEEIYFAGGEPLVMEEHYQILEMLIQRGKTDIRLKYSTNFSTRHFKGRDVFALWNQFEQVHLLASLDGSGRRGELQRKGQVWADVVAMRQQLLKEAPHVHFIVCSTITAMNVLHLPDFHVEWVEAALVNADDFIPHILKRPEQLSIQILPAELKRRVIDRYQRHLEWLDTHVSPALVKMPITRNEFQSVIPYITDRDKTALIPDFLDFTAKLDSFRGEDFLQVFPELELLYRDQGSHSV